MVLKSSLLAGSDEREAAKFEAEKGRTGVSAAGWGGGGGGKGKGVTTAGNEGAGGGNGRGGGGGMVYDLLAVVVHRGSAYSGHYHALIRDCLQEVRQQRGEPTTGNANV